MDAVSTPSDRPDGRGPADYAESVALPAAPEAVPAILSGADWWAARPAGARLVGLVVARDDLPSVIAQRDALAQFGVPIEGFRHPAPETGESWSERLTRLFGRLTSGDVVVVADKHALGRTTDEETHAIAELRRRGVIVKVLGSSRS
ncbi:MAG: dehydrogenase [Microbacterium sp.]